MSFLGSVFSKTRKLEQEQWKIWDLSDMLGKLSGHSKAVCLEFAARITASVGMRANRTSGHTGRIQLPGCEEPQRYCCRFGDSHTG